MGATLLLADDSITIQRVIELTFADEDIRVLVASDGQQAIQKIDAERPDIVLADVGMPRVDGYGVASHIKQSASLKHIAVLLLTGAFEPIDEARARDTGCDGVLVKPFEPRILVARVKELLGGQRGPELWPADMPRAQPDRPPTAPPVPVPPPGLRPLPELLRAGQDEVPAPPLSVTPPAPQPVFDLGDVAAAPVEPAATLEGDVVDQRMASGSAKAVRSDLPPPADRLDMELDMLDAALSRLDPTARPHELDAATASDFARDLNELRRDGAAEEVPSRPSRPSFGTWDLPKTGTAAPISDEPIDIVAEEIPLRASIVEPLAPAPIEPISLAIASAPVADPLPTPPPVSASAVRATPGLVTPPSPPAERQPDPGAEPAERPTLAAAFGALLAAEKSRPSPRAAEPAAAMSEAAIEEVVRRVLARMTNETVNRVVLETAERLIREEISRTKDPSGR